MCKKSGLRRPSLCHGDSKSKKSVLPHQDRLHVIKHTKRGCFPFRFYFNTNKCIYAQGLDSRTSRTTTSCWWSSSGHRSSRYILLCIRIKSCYSVVLYLLWNLCNNHPFLDPSSSVSCPFLKKKICSVFVLHREVDTEKCWVTGAKVMTFAASTCVHNLPQTSNSIGKLIDTKYPTPK
jgi:hypothetical protein